MKNETQSLLDHPYLFRALAVAWYIMYLSKVFIAFTVGKIPIIPNVWITLVSIFSITYLTLIAAKIEVSVPSKKWLITRMLLGIIPTMLAMFLTIRWIRKQREEEAPAITYLGPLVMAIVFAYMSTLFMLVGISVLLFDPIPGHGLYLISILAFWSMIGFTLGELIDIDKMKSRFIYNIIIDVDKRRIFTLILSILLILVTLLPISHPPISIDHQIDEPVYISDSDAIKNIEKIADTLMLNEGYNGSDAPTVISHTVLNKTRILAYEQFGIFKYVAEIIEVNTTLSEIVSNKTLVYQGVIISNTTNLLQEITLNSSYTLLYQYLEDPFDRGAYVRSIVVLQNSIPVLWASENNKWISLNPNFT